MEKKTFTYKQLDRKLNKVIKKVKVLSKMKQKKVEKVLA